MPCPTGAPSPSSRHDPILPGPAAALHAVLDRPGWPPGRRTGEVLPTCWHWIYFLHWPAHRDLGEDGHPADGPFLPPVPNRRRMFAGGRVRVHAPLRLDEPAVRTTSLVGAVVKEGRSGEMLFVTVRDEIEQGGQLRVVEEQDLMYRSGDLRRPTGGSRSRSAGRLGGTVAAAVRRRRRAAGPVQRIDRERASHPLRPHYVTGVEGYPGLVVHGPLLVLLMTGLVPWQDGIGDGIATVDYRLRRPVFAGEAVLATGRPRGADAAELRVLGPAGEVRASAHVSLG